MAMRDLPVPDVPGSVPYVDPAAAAPHVASVGALLATMMGWLPFFVAIVPMIYYLILIFESKTVQDLLARWRSRRAAKALAKLKAKTMVVGAKIEAAAEVQTAKVMAAAKVDNAVVDANALVANTAAGVTGPVGP